MITRLQSLAAAVILFAASGAAAQQQDFSKVEIKATKLIEGFNAVIELARPNTRIVPGHGAVVDEQAVAAHRDMAVALRDRVAGPIKQGRTQEQILATKPTAVYDARVPQPGTTGDRFIGQLYAELGGK